MEENKFLHEILTKLNCDLISGTKPYGSSLITFQAHHTFPADRIHLRCKIPYFYFVYTFPIAFHKTITNKFIEIWTRQRLSGQLVNYKNSLIMGS
jgi:hypothetical protein